jgi:hypothetical protein
MDDDILLHYQLISIPRYTSMEGNFSRKEMIKIVHTPWYYLRISVKRKDNHSCKRRYSRPGSGKDKGPRNLVFPKIKLTVRFASLQDCL